MRRYLCKYPTTEKLYTLLLYRSMAIIAGSNAKGGVSKTTTSICLATLLGDDGDVLLIDADQNQSAVLWARADKLPFDVVTEKASRKSMMSGKYSHIIIDSQSAPESGEAKALANGSDLLIVPTTPDGPALAATGRMFAELGEVENALALITVVPPSPQKDGAEAAESLTAAKIRHFDRQIRAGKAYKRAFENGLTLPQMGSKDRAGQLWRDWVALKTELMEAIK